MIYNKIIAADFDGTIKSENNIHEHESEPVEDCVEVIRNLHDTYNCRFILNTCREGELLEKAKDYLKKHDIYDCFELFNENIPELHFKSRKIFANYYIDDLNAGGLYSWKQLENDVINEIDIEVSKKFKTFYHGTSWRNFQKMIAKYNPQLGLFKPCDKDNWTCSGPGMVYFYCKEAFIDENEDENEAERRAFESAQITSARQQSQSNKTVVVKIMVPEPLWEYFMDDCDADNAFWIDADFLNQEIEKNHIQVSFLIAENSYNPDFRLFYLAGVNLEWINLSDDDKRNVKIAKEVCEGISDIQCDLFDWEKYKFQTRKVDLNFFNEKAKSDAARNGLKLDIWGDNFG